MSPVEQQFANLDRADYSPDQKITAALALLGAGETGSKPSLRDEERQRLVKQALPLTMYPAERACGQEHLLLALAEAAQHDALPFTPLERLALLDSGAALAAHPAIDEKMQTTLIFTLQRALIDGKLPPDAQAGRHVLDQSIRLGNSDTTAPLSRLSLAEQQLRLLETTYIPATQSNRRQIAATAAAAIADPAVPHMFKTALGQEILSAAETGRVALTHHEFNAVVAAVISDCAGNRTLLHWTFDRLRRVYATLPQPEIQTPAAARNESDAAKPAAQPGLMGDEFTPVDAAKIIAITKCSMLPKTAKAYLPRIGISTLFGISTKTAHDHRKKIAAGTFNPNRQHILRRNLDLEVLEKFSLLEPGGDNGLHDDGSTAGVTFDRPSVQRLLDAKAAPLTDEQCARIQDIFSRAALPASDERHVTAGSMRLIFGVNDRTLERYAELHRLRALVPNDRCLLLANLHREALQRWN